MHCGKVQQTLPQKGCLPHDSWEQKESEEGHTQ